MKYLMQFFCDFFQDLKLSEKISNIYAILLTLATLFIIVWLVRLICRYLFRKLAVQLIKKTRTHWDDYLMQRKVFAILAHLPSALILLSASHFSNIADLSHLLEVIARIYLVIIGATGIVRTANAVNDIYQTTPYANSRPIKGYVQLFQILTIFIAIILFIAALLNKSPFGLFAGLGAMAAVLLLVFKDSILGFVASIQLSANHMVKPGDWITMPSHHADGTVTDISLNTVKVQNWDKTITTIPTYALVSESFYNWTGMEQSGGRRIKRSINIDMNSVHFCTKELLEKLSHFYLLKEYIKQKEDEITSYNNQLNISENEIFNGRRQTNLGIFRYYLEAYLHQNPNISDDMTLMVRHLQPTEKGIPLEIYAFSNKQDWEIYEKIQADLMDHILAILPEFELSVFQNPGGKDIRDLLAVIENKRTENLSK